MAIAIVDNVISDQYVDGISSHKPANQNIFPLDLYNPASAPTNDNIIRLSPIRSRNRGPVDEKPSDKLDDLVGEIRELTAGERRLVEAFVRAVRNERGHGELDYTRNASDLSEVGLGGRLPELFDAAADMAMLPPARAPRTWSPNSGEVPALAVLDIYGYWIDRGKMHRGTLREQQPELYAAWWSTSRAYATKSPEEQAAILRLKADLPTKPEFIDRMLQASPSTKDAKLRQQRLRSSRKSRGIDRDK